MTEKYIVEGPALDNVLKENRIRVKRGLIKFTPLNGEAEDTTEVAPEEDVKDIPIEDTKDIPEEDTKEVAPEEEKKTAPKKSKK